MDYLALGDNLISFSENRIVANRIEETEPEDLLLKKGSIKRISVFKNCGTNDQMIRYFEKLSKLIGEDIEVLSNRHIKFRNEELDLDRAQIVIFDFVKSFY